MILGEGDAQTGNSGWEKEQYQFMANIHNEALEQWKAARRELDFSSELARKGWYHSFELPDGRCFDGHESLAKLRTRIAQMPIPGDLTGKRVLDIGAWDGWFSFEMERRGAEVVAVDCVEVANFLFIHRELGSHVEYRVMDLYDLSPEKVGYFDIVLFLGVLYHLKHPLLALEKVCALTRDIAIVSSFITDAPPRPAEELMNEIPRMEFYETDEMARQVDNWLGPNLACVLGLCRTAGFARVNLLGIEWPSASATIGCYRKWGPLLGASSQPPVLIAADHNRNYGINFKSDGDDYVSYWFASDAQSLTLEQVYPEVDGYGVRPISVTKLPDGRWQCNFLLPPGLPPGWHSVRLRQCDSGASNTKRIAVDMPVVADRIAICAAADGLSFEPDIVRLESGGYLSLWVSGLPENADRNNVRVFLDSARLVTEYVENRPCEALQVNARFTETIKRGTYSLKVRLEGVESASLPVRIE